tara:strand:- start:99 stop:260 length:162 start_codon:yes stop_codon:yes gene_type:complete
MLAGWIIIFLVVWGILYGITQRTYEEQGNKGGGFWPSFGWAFLISGFIMAITS